MQLVFDDRFGYFWLFPRREELNEVNIGVGFFYSKNLSLKKILESFKAKFNIEGEIDHITGGLIPEGLQPPLKYRNILFVGDAGVGTFPLSGQGIYRALLSGETAGKCIVENKINLYPKRIKKLFYKWNIIGCNCIYLNSFLYHINPSLVLTCLNRLYTFTNLIHI